MACIVGFTITCSPAASQDTIATVSSGSCLINTRDISLTSVVRTWLLCNQSRGELPREGVGRAHVVLKSVHRTEFDTLSRSRQSWQRVAQRISVFLQQPRECPGLEDCGSAAYKIGRQGTENPLRHSSDVPHGTHFISDRCTSRTSWAQLGGEIEVHVVDGVISL